MGLWILCKGLDMYGKEIHIIFEPTTLFYSHGETDGFEEIDPKTLCRCTSSHDKDGKLIFENDIVEFNIYNWEKLEQSTISQVKWCDDLCALSIVVNDRGTRGTLGHLLDGNKEAKVLGNIFDNPELLEKNDIPERI